jgi:hypothetical protein
LGICLLAENLFVVAYYLIDLTRQHVEEFLSTEAKELLKLGACSPFILFFIVVIDFGLYLMVHFI